MEKRRVLVVDDDAALAENLAEIVAELDVEVEVAGSSRAALSVADIRPADVALVDVRLPDGSGIDLIPQLAARCRFIKVVLITGDATLESAIDAVRGGAFAYVLKPFSPPDLLDTVRRALTQVGLQKEHEQLRLDLERSEFRHRQVVDAVPAFVLALDASDRIALWNRRLEEKTGVSRDDMIGQPGGHLVRSDRPQLLPMKNDGELLVRWERAELDLPEGHSTYAVGIDVTTEKEMLRRVLRAERLAAVGTLAAGLAHEIRNPLNSASLQLQVLQRRLAKGEHEEAALTPVIDLVRDEISRLERLVSDFLAFVKPRPLDLKQTSVNDLCRSVLELLRPEADAKAVRIREDLAETLPSLSADPERLRQVLLNLARNGIDAMPEGGELVVRTRLAGDDLEIEVEDTGVGFADEAPIFDAFFTTKAGGTGLGLTIVHRIVSDHRGTIRLRSRPGQTCVTVALPIS